MPIRVTEVLSFFKEEWYVDWVCRVGKREAGLIGRAAMKVGSRVDEIIKEGNEPCAKDSHEVKTAFGAWKKFCGVYSPSSIITGVRVFKVIEGQDVTGEPDLIIDGVLVDVKCAGKISLTYWIQVMMYRFLRGETGPVAILRLDKHTGAYEYVVRDYDESLVTVWVGLMRAMVYLKGDEDGTDV